MTWQLPMSLAGTFSSNCTRAAVIACALLVQACAVSSELSSARLQFRSGSVETAQQTLSTAEVSQRDKLLLLLDKGLVAQAAGQYQQSAVAFEDAYQLIDRLDFVSARDQASALIANDWAIRYSGEYSERLWIHTFQMINYLMMGQPQGAAVEARRAVVLFEEHGDVLNSDLFTRYLMALSFDAAGQSDSASVEFRKLKEQLGKNINPLRTTKEHTDVILLIASGFMPPKLPGDLVVNIDARISFPFYPDVVNRAPSISVRSDNEYLPLERIDTHLLPVAQNALAKRGKAIAARHALRLAAKYNLAKNIEEQDPLAAELARLFFLVIEQADTRSWETLPAWLSLVRVSVPLDTPSLSIDIGSTHGSLSSHRRQILLGGEDSRAPGQPQFRIIRTGVQNHGVLIASP